MDDTPTQHDKHDRDTPGSGKRRLSGAAIALAVIGVLIGVQLFRMRPAPAPAMFGDDLGLADAIDRAESQGRLVLAVVTAKWCGPCQQYKRGALADPRVEAWVDAHAVPVYIDFDREPQTAQELGVSRLPASFLLDHGTIVASLPGRRDAGDLLSWLESNCQARPKQAQPAEPAQLPAD